MTDSQEYLSPYHYGFNNPIRFSDPNGLIGDDCCGPGKSNLIRSDATSVAKRLSNIPNSGQSSSKSSALTVSVSVGKQVALEVAGVGFEVNFGSKEVFKMTEEVSSKDKIAGSSKSAIELDPSTSKGFSIDIGVASLGQETKTKEITTMTSISGTNLKLPTTQTVTEKTGSIGVGLGKSPIGGSLEGGKTTTSYLGGQSKTEHTSGSLKGSYSTILPGYGGKTKSGIEFSIGIGYKIDVKVDPVQATKNFLGIK